MTGHAAAEAKLQAIWIKLDLIDLSIACTLKLLIKATMGSLVHW